MKKFFTMSRIHAGVVLLTVAGAFMFYAYSSGIAGVTRKNGEGCTCHGSSATTSVSVTIAGPETLQVNQTGQYTVTVTGGPLAAAGANVAASTGTLTAGTGLKKVGAELTHTAAKTPSAGSVSFQFSYAAPSTPGSVTLYATGNSVNLSTDPDGDAWNHAPNKTVTVLTVVPVELTSFSAVPSADGIALRWTTATELNNKGFFVERSGDKSSWTRLSFINGNGTTSSPSEYTFMDRTAGNSANFYRLVQVDYNGAEEIHILSGEIRGSVPDFALLQNYPNPFNPSTVISYSLPVDGFVTIKVYSVSGELISAPVSKMLPAGAYAETFSAKGLTSGIYFYELTVRGENNAKLYSKTRKMIISR